MDKQTQSKEPRCWFCLQEKRDHKGVQLSCGIGNNSFYEAQVQNPEPWAIGKVLMTIRTSKWTPEQIKTENIREERSIYSGFTPADEGKSRKPVAEFRNHEDAKRAVACVNALAGIPDPAAFVARARKVEEPQEISELSKQLYDSINSHNARYADLDATKVLPMIEKYMRQSTRDLAEALKEYSQHKSDCESLTEYAKKRGILTCTCGLDAALRKLGEGA